MTRLQSHTGFLQRGSCRHQGCEQQWCSCSTTAVSGSRSRKRDPIGFGRHGDDEWCEHQGSLHSMVLCLSSTT